MNPRHREWIKDSVMEYTRRNNFIRIFPAPGSECYDKYFQIPRISNKLLYKFLYGQDFVMELQNFFYPVVRQEKPVIAVIEEKETTLKPKINIARKVIGESE